MVRIGLLGCGNIGGIIARHKIGIEITSFFDAAPAKVDTMKGLLEHARAHYDFDNFIRDEFEILVEAASVGAVLQYGETALQRGKDLVALSVGAFADRGFRNRLEVLAGSLGRKIRIPSGALFGLDNLKIGQVSALDRLVLRTTKHPAAFGLQTQERTLLFEGSAEECIRHYPRNVNVAVALSLAAERPVAVQLWADPAVTRNTHEIHIAGAFGETTILTQNLPSPDNPSTSYLAALSIITLLKNLDRPLVVGT